MAPHCRPNNVQIPYRGFHIHLDLVSTQCTFIESYFIPGPVLGIVNEPKMLPALGGKKKTISWSPNLQPLLLPTQAHRERWKVGIVLFSGTFSELLKVCVQERLYIILQPTLFCFNISSSMKPTMRVPFEDESPLPLTFAHLFMVDHGLLTITALYLPVISSKSPFPKQMCSRKLSHTALIYVCY